jgi:hypothetical protein
MKVPTCLYGLFSLIMILFVACGTGLIASTHQEGSLPNLNTDFKLDESNYEYEVTRMLGKSTLRLVLLPSVRDEMQFYEDKTTTWTLYVYGPEEKTSELAAFVGEWEGEIEYSISTVGMGTLKDDYIDVTVTITESEGTYAIQWDGTDTQGIVELVPKSDADA